ncbi:lymphocyte cytosolic protein 2a [Rhinichthys klamathensis goyatoka]|uniref:lymphocyte cytosolic protein 2a n=1 Tax=Rhinichthys klamathensis goyatoka TaxID=3034132 RepID=UPI0024B5DAE7|nr:lymphocyte cytosolic protein 2a [Rhinichthys klamathensis goyatoka]
MLEDIRDLIFISKCSKFGTMSFDGVPSKSEVLSWDSHRLADFLKKRNLTGCDKVITRYNISGQRFLSMTENDLQKFPKLHAPLISKICQEINKEKKRFFPPIPAIRPSQPVPSFPQPPVDQYEDQAWDPEEFDSEDDYEDPNEDNNSEGDASGGDYESPEEGSDSDNGYEPPPSEPKEDTAQICPAKPMENSDYVDNNRTRAVSRSQPPVPPERPGPGPSLPHVERPSVGQHLREERPLKRPPAPAVDRSKKPGTLDRSHPPPVAGGRGTSSLDRAVQPPRGITAAPLRLPAVECPGDPMRIPKPLLPPSGVRRSASSITPGYSQNRHLDRHEFHDDTARHSSNTFPLHARNPSPRPPGTHGQPFQTDTVSPSRSLPAKLKEAMNDQLRSTRAPLPPQTDMGGMQDMDPAWYVGQITRGEAESCLRRVNRDGTFLVRDSSNRSSNQPYTLVVLYQEKVYNIQIRRSQNGFMLGTGMKSSETFERVGGIINQHKHTPLLLIDAKNRESSQQKQCALIYPAGY